MYLVAFYAGLKTNYYIANENALGKIFSSMFRVHQFFYVYSSRVNSAFHRNLSGEVIVFEIVYYFSNADIGYVNHFHF